MTPRTSDVEVRALTTEFVNSGYRGAEYADWPIERRLERFLRGRGFSGHAGHGDMCRSILERIMTHGHRGGYGPPR